MKKEWLGKFLDLSSGIPSHDRFNAILATLNSAEFEKCLLTWITALATMKATAWAWEENTTTWTYDVLDRMLTICAKVRIQ